MKRLFLFLFAVSIGTRITLAQISPSIDAQLQTTLDSVCNHYNIKGASAAVLVPNVGIWKGTHGISQIGIPITTDMLFGIGSNTKTYVAAVLLKMQENNLLDLDDTIGTWIQHPNISGQITIRQLLNHRSGLYNYTSNPALNTAIISNFAAVWLPEQILNYVNTPLFAAGASWSYSNTNYLVAGLIIKDVLNQPVSTAINNLIQPLNLPNTILFPETSLSGPMVNIWTINFFQPYLEDIVTNYNYNHNAMFSVAWAAGAILSTAEENVIFMNNLLSGQLLSNASLQEMKQWNTLSSTKAYGLGLFRTTNFNGRTVFGHGGTNVGFINENIYDNVNGVTISVLTNQDSISNIIILNQVVKALHQVTLSMPVSVEENTLSNLLIFPNPATDKLNILLNSENHYTIQLMDLTGRIITSEETESNLIQLSIVNYSAGIYLLRITDKKTGQSYATEKVIINR